MMLLKLNSHVSRVVVLSDPSSRFAPVWATVDWGSGPHIRGKWARLERHHDGHGSSRGDGESDGLL